MGVVVHMWYIINFSCGYTLVSVPDAHAKTRKGVWANAVEFLTKQEVLSSRIRHTSCDNPTIKTNMACGFITVP